MLTTHVMVDELHDISVVDVHTQRHPVRATISSTGGKCILSLDCAEALRLHRMLTEILSRRNLLGTQAAEESHVESS